MISREKFSCILVCSDEDKKLIMKELNDSSSMSEGFVIVSIEDKFELSIQEARRRYDGVLFKDQIESADLIIYCPPSHGKDALDSLIVSAEKNVKISVLRISKQAIPNLKSQLNNIKEIINTQLQEQRLNEHYDSLLNTTINISNDINYWSERYNPCVVKTIKSIIQLPQLSSKEKWGKIVAAANVSPKSSTWMSSFVKERHPDTTLFCNAIKDQTEEALQAFLKNMTDESKVNFTPNVQSNFSGTK